MKKFVFLSFICFSVIFSFSCKNEKSRISKVNNLKSIDFAEESYEPVIIENFEDCISAMKPDYSIGTPEISKSALKAIKKSDGKKNGVTTKVVQSIKKLSDYKTQYSDSWQPLDFDASKITKYKDDSKKTKKSKNSDVFEVEDWGPQGEINNTQAPCFYVIFSKPVKSLSALEIPSDKSDFVTIEPSVSGVFRWYGNQHLSFECSEPLNPAQQYTIKVNPEVKSVDGDNLTGNTEFKTSAANIFLRQAFAGYIGDGEYNYNYRKGLVPPFDKKYFIRLNYAVPASGIQQILKFKVDSYLSEKNLSYTAEPVYDSLEFCWGQQNKLIASKENETTNTFVVTVSEEIPSNTTLYVCAAADGDYSSKQNQKSFKTLKPFAVDSVKKYADYSTGKKTFPLTVNFNQIPDEKTVPQNISFDFDFNLTKDNFEIQQDRLIIFNMPVNFGENHTITIKSGLKDIYGQALASDSQYDFKIKKPQAYVKVLNSGMHIMEAQFPHKYIIEYQNVNEYSNYSVEATNRPLFTEFESPETKENHFMLDFETENQRQFEEIDLNPYLVNGYGAVCINTALKYDYYDYKNQLKEQNEKSTAVIQVTNLGVTARIGFNKAVVLVSDLKTGKPVKNASVYILPNDTKTDIEQLVEKSYGHGNTDENGFCEINFTEESVSRYEQYSKERWKMRFNLVYVVNGDDKVVYEASSHNPWRSGVYTSDRNKARQRFSRTFMFVDRGVYKPGETVTFRGIDRDQILGNIQVAKGDYKITVKEIGYKSPAIVPVIEGSLSASGGFYGSFKLPEDLAPDSYEISYKRNDESGSARIYFTVAEFERLKLETKVEIPDLKYYGGDSISAAVSADYLAGGAVADGKYEVNWFKQPVSVDFNNIELKNYKFGPKETYDGRQYFSESKGKLDGFGNAAVSCKTDKITTGQTFSYRIASTVTDVSNQSVGAASSVLVHPALYYIGLGKPQNVSGFAKKGEKLEFPYIIVKTDGQEIANTSSVQKLEYKLTREEWTVAHEQSLYNSIYSRYTRQEVEEAKGNIEKKSKGIFNITPQSSGWYTLEISGTDSKGNLAKTEYGFYVTGGNSFWYNNNDSSTITLTPDQNLYNPGDTAHILMQSQLPAGDYLITVERDGIFTEEVRHFDSPANVIDVKIAKNYLPVVYVCVSSYSVRNGAPVHEYGDVDLDKPKGFFGVTPVFVDSNVKAFSVSVECDKPSYRPGDMVTLTMTATKGGKPFQGAELTVMAVDRGVLDLIDYHVPNPIKFFYNEGNFPLRVNGGDSRAYLMDPVTYSVKDLAGGDADEEKEDERKDFRPTAVFEPELITDKNGKVSCTFKMPDSLTTYRITAFGVSNDLFALNEEEIKVQNPINVQQVQPRKLRVRDTAECGVLITNLSEKEQTVTVNCQVQIPQENTAEDELNGRITVPGNAFLESDSEYTVTVASGDSTVVYFTVAAQQAGTVELVYSIKSDLLNERLISPVKIEQSYVYETVTMTGSTGADNKTETERELLVIPDFAKNGEGDLRFTLDATRLGTLKSAVNYVFEYPYGCLEQQSSKVLPLIIYEDYIKIFDLDSKISNVRKCVKKYTNEWKKSQLSNGAFPYWPDGNYASNFVTIKIAHVCAVALKHGYSEKDLGINLESLKNYLAEISRDKNYYSTQRAYGAYVLSLFGDERALNILKVLNEGRGDLSYTGLAYLGLGFAELNNKTALDIASEIRKNLEPSQRSVTLLPKSSDVFDFWFDSKTGEIALILKLFSSLKADDKMVDKLLYTLLKEKSVGGYWNNTADTTKVLDSVYAFIKARKLDSLNLEGYLALDGNELLKGNFKGAGAEIKTLSYKFNQSPVAELKRNSELPLEVTKKGNGDLYYTVEMKYSLPDENYIQRDEGLKLTYSIKDIEENTDLSLSQPVVHLEAGKTYRVSVEIQSPRDRTYVALRSPVPSGAEIIDSTFVTNVNADEAVLFDGGRESIMDFIADGYTLQRQRLTNKVIYDNEVQFFWDKFKSGATTVTYTFRTARRGIYPTPPVQSECMYEPEISGRTNGYLFIIK